MKPLLTALMLGTEALFLFGALQHAGVAIGSLHEPVIVPASVVEVLCAVALSWGAAAVLKQSLKAWRAAFIGNLVAIIGVAIGMVALAVGAGPRTASNDLLPRNHAGAGDRLACDPPCSRGTHGAEA
jgi:hypothetical protein